MLLAIGDRWLSPEAVKRVLDEVLEGMAGAAPGVVLATSPAEVDESLAAGHPTVLSMGDDQPELRLESAVASAAAVLWITASDSTDVRSQLRLDTGSRRVTPIVSIVVSAEQPDLGRNRGQGVTNLWVSSEPTRRDQRCLHRVGRRLAWTAVAPPPTRSS